MATESPRPDSLLKLILYGGAPFFGNPLKPFVNAMYGANYERAYTHFRRDHTVPGNIFYHLLCFGFQLTFNYSFLSELDAKLFGSGRRAREPARAHEDGEDREQARGKGVAGDEDDDDGVGPLALSTTVLWSAILLRSSRAPLPVRLAAVFLLGLFYKLRHGIRARYRSLMSATCALEALGIVVFVLSPGKKDSSGVGRVPFDAAQYAKVLAVRLLLHFAVRGRLAGSPKAAAAANLLTAVVIGRGTQDPFGAFGNRLTPFVFSFIGNILSSATDQPLLYFYMSGFLATIQQGVAHHYSGQQGTLPQLSDIADDLAHTTFFPNLLLHSAFQTWGMGDAGAKPMFA